MEQRTYIAIDLKSFYASVECVERGLDPMTTNLVVADASRTTKTICLAVSPALKDYQIAGRPRLFEVAQRVSEVNASRKELAPGHVFTGSSTDAAELALAPTLSLDYITALPRMALYMACSTKIYNIYLNYIAPEDIHVYSIDEVFIDVTAYLPTYKLTARELAMKLIIAVLKATGITATAGIGTNLYLSKVAMDIGAKHIPADKNGVRIAQLDEISYRHLLWSHRPLTDFWRVGRGYTKKLEAHGLFTMGDIARCSIGKHSDYYNEDLLYQLFGVNAELLIDHAWGWEPCTIADIKRYRPKSSSINSGQVLPCPYPFEKAKLVVREMADLLALDLVDQGLVTNQLVLSVGYDQNLDQNTVITNYEEQVLPKYAHGTENLGKYTSYAKLILQSISLLFDRIVAPDLFVRRIYVTVNHVVAETSISEEMDFEQLDLFTDYEQLQEQKEVEQAELEREKKMQSAVLEINKKFGKNSILKGMNLESGATTMERNKQIGGHKA